MNAIMASRINPPELPDTADMKAVSRAAIASPIKTHGSIPAIPKNWSLIRSISACYSRCQAELLGMPTYIDVYSAVIPANLTIAHQRASLENISPGGAV